MGLISIGGLGSGLDIASIVGALVEAEKAPKQNSLDRQEADVTVTLTGLGGLSSALDELRTAALDLSLNSSFQKRSVSVSNSDYFTATAASGASPGNYDIEVTALAQGSNQQSSVFTGGATTTFGTGGTLTFTIGNQTFDVAVSNTDTLQDIRNNINAATGNDFVSANLLNNVTSGANTGSVLNFDSSVTGTGNDLVVTYTGDASLADLSTNLTQTQAASDASISLDGFTATSSTNTFTDVIQDITLEVKQVHTLGSTDSIKVEHDIASTTALISNFVDTYNAFIDVTTSLGAATPEAPGLLVGDYTLRQVSGQIKNLVSDTIPSVSGNYNSLSSIGITTTREGKLEIDYSVLDTAVTESFDQFDELFAGSDGFATKLRDLVDNYTGSNGIITQRESSLNNQLERVADDRVSLELRIQALELRLNKQFSQMDALVAQFNSTQSYIAQQFENLPGFGSKKK